MILTLTQRVTVRVLDSVIDRGRRSSNPALRTIAAALDRARGLAGLDHVPRAADLPTWSGDQPTRPMWDSDRRKLRKWQVDQGIVRDEGAKPTPAPVAAAIKVYYKRGCPYARAAIELLRERDIAFVEQDVKGDPQTLEWLQIVTGRKTTPQIFVNEKPIGGYDELRGLDQSGELARMLGIEAAAAKSVTADAGDETMSVADLRALVDEGAPVLTIDVRSHAEADATGMLSHAVLAPLQELEAAIADLDREAVWIVYCKAGTRSRQALPVLREHGFRNVVSLAGGIDAWIGDGGAVVRVGAMAPRTKPARVKLPVVHPERSPFELVGDYTGAIAERLEGDALTLRVREVLEECRPMIQRDGGDLELLDIQGDVVHVALTGNCVGCPSSQATLRQGIERRLLQAIPQLTGIASPQLM